MKILTGISMLMLLMFFNGCSSSTYYQDGSPEISLNKNLEHFDPSIPLSEHLRRLPGVSVQGSGYYAKVRMPGIKSYSGDPEPLFVVDGHILCGGYKSAAGLVDVNDIAAIRVHRNINDLSEYGMRGANGVIEIITKK